MLSATGQLWLIDPSNIEPLPPAALRRRLRAARTFGTRGRLSVTAGRDALYTTAKSLLEQAEAQDPVGSAWEEKLRERSG